MMRKSLLVVSAGALLLTACGGGGGVFGRDRPDEFAVGRAAPLVIPPDYSLTPPKPGAPRPIGADSQSQALDTLFPSTPPSASEQNLLDQSGATRPNVVGARSTAGSPDTLVVDKGAFTRDLVAAPATPATNVASLTVGG